MMRSEKLRRLVAMLPCMCCGQKGQTQAAHANFQSFGKGIKASDAALMALCVRCHAELDQGQTMTKEERRNAQYEWIAKTWAALGAGEGCGMKAERHQARNSSGACVLSQSANAASIRVCQPLPVSRKALTTEGERRSDNAILVGRFCGPRTPNFLSKEGGNTSYAGRARAKSSSVHSGFSSSIISGLGFFIAFDLSRIGFTKTNHSNTALCFDKYKGVQTLIEQPKRPIAYFTVVTPVIDFKKSGFEIEILGPFKRQLALCNVAFVLFGVKGNVH